MSSIGPHGRSWSSVFLLGPHYRGLDTRRYSRSKKPWHVLQEAATEGSLQGPGQTAFIIKFNGQEVPQHWAPGKVSIWIQLQGDFKDISPSPSISAPNTLKQEVSRRSRGHIKHAPHLRFCGPDHGGLGPAGGMPREGQRRRWKQFPWSMLEGNYQRKGKVISYLKLTNFNYAEKIALLKKSQKREVKKKKTRTKIINIVGIIGIMNPLIPPLPIYF